MALGLQRECHLPEYYLATPQEKLNFESGGRDDAMNKNWP